MRNRARSAIVGNDDSGSPAATGPLEIDCSINKYVPLCFEKIPIFVLKAATVDYLNISFKILPEATATHRPHEVD